MELDIGAMIRELRQKKNWTQLELANKLGYQTMQFVSLFERGLSKPPKKILGKLVILVDLPEKKVRDYLVKEFENSVIAEMDAGKKELKSPKK